MKFRPFILPIVIVASIVVAVVLYFKSPFRQVRNIIKMNLDNAVERYNADGAIAILMKSDTGKIIAMYETPVRNAIFGKNYEFGHLTGVFNMVIAWENGISADRNILLESKNAEQMKLATELPESAQSKFFDKIHFNDVLTVGSNTTTQPDLPKEWTKSERAKAGIGYGIKITPIHLIYGLNAVVNDGLYVNSRNHSSERVISSETSSKIRDIMHEIIQTTIMPNATIQNIGMKTASIKKSDNKTITTASFATFPIDNPKYSMLIILDNPHGTPDTHGNKTASWNVVPLSGRILYKIIPILGK